MTLRNSSLWKKRRSFFQCLEMLTLAMLVAVPAGAQRYEITDLGTLGGAVSRAYAINDAGQVAGEAETRDGKLRAFIWTKEEGMTDLGTLGGELSRANGMNGRGVVVGEAETESGALCAFRWTAETGMTPLALPAGAEESYAYGINNFGFVVGAYETERGSQAVMWSVEGVEKLAVLPEAGSSIAYDINDMGDVAGQGEIGDEGSFVSHAVVYREGGPPQSLAVLDEGLSASARAINRHGMIVGYAERSVGRSHAFLYDATKGMQDVDMLDGAFSAAYGLNDRGEVVGVFFGSQGDDEHAFLFKNDAMADLNDVVDSSDDWQLIEARGINSASQIVGYGLLNERERAFLLTPVESQDGAGPLRIRLTTPSNIQNQTEPAGLLLVAEVDAKRNDIQRVVFYANGQVLGSTNVAPYEFAWGDVAAGEYDAAARVFDRRGRVGLSNRLRIHVELRDPTPDAAPQETVAGEPASP